MFHGTRNLGLRSYLRFRRLRLRDKWSPRPGLLTLTAKNATYPLAARGDSSDLSVFSAVFLRRAYACLDHVRSPELILDCGANVGYSSAYFLTRFPGCRVVAVEPDADNFEIMRRNLKPYGDRVQLVHAAVWSQPAKLSIQELPYRDGRAWSRQVRECLPGERPTVRGVDVGTLLRESGCSRISILKVDVEGAEAVIFSQDCGAWLDRADNIAIELHDDSSFGAASAIFAEAIAGRGFSVSRRGELTVCTKAA
jgi:FkbM family methyltransferase